MIKKIFFIIIIIFIIYIPHLAYKQKNNEVSKKPDIVIGIIYKTLDESWFEEEGKAAKNQALKMGAKDVIMIDARMNPDVYLSALDNLITQKVSGILVCVPDQKLSKITVDRCKKSNIPVIASDDPLTDDKGNYLAPFVGIDATQVGQDIANSLVDYLSKNNKLDELQSSGLLLMTMDSVSSCIPRTNGQLETFTKRLPNFPKENIFKSDYNGEAEKSFNSAASIIINNKHIKNWFIMSANEEGCTGAIRALEQSGLTKDAVAVGLGDSIAKYEFQKENSSFVASAYINPTEVGETAAKELMENILFQKKIPDKYLIKDKIITRDNYKNLTLK